MLGPGHVLDDDAEQWSPSWLSHSGQIRIASSFLPVADTGRGVSFGCALIQPARICSR